MDSTIPVHPHHRPASTLEKGMRIAAGFLPLAAFLPRRGEAEVLFAYPYQLHGKPRVCVVYLYDGDGQPVADDFRGDALIPVVRVVKPIAPESTTAACVWDVQGQAPSTICALFPLCECPPPAEWSDDNTVPASPVCLCSVGVERPADEHDVICCPIGRQQYEQDHPAEASR
jgi:hypothetical protein